MDNEEWMRKYFEEIENKLDAMSDEEFVKLIDGVFDDIYNMRNLTAEEQESYSIGFSKLSKPTGIKLFRDKEK